MRLEDISELAGQLFEVLEPWGKFRDNALKPVLIHMATFRVGNLCIRPCIPSPQSTCCSGPCPLPSLPAIYVNMTITNAHLYKDIEKRLEIVPISVALTLQHLDRYELHSASAIASSTQHTIQLLR